MQSITKNIQTDHTIREMVKKAFLDYKILHITELTEGYFNVAYLIELADQTEVILKIAPPIDSRIMTYEKNIMFSEVDSMKRIARETQVPVADILYYDKSHTLCESDYFFMSKLPGRSLNSFMDTLSEAEIRRIYFQLGQYNQILNQIENKAFGYYGQEDRQGSNWFEVFHGMILDTIKDAESLNIDLQTDPSVILEQLHRDRPFFDEVTKPQFVHWDLWAGNIFIENGRITGFIDFERCLWADVLMEVSFRPFEYQKEFFLGYGIKELTPSQKRRAKWYDIYLYLISALETDYRQYETRDSYHWATSKLKEGLKELNSIPA